MYGNKAYDCESIRNYNGADRHFKETKPVRSEKWRSDERPLRRRSQHHYRLQHGTWQGRNFYDVIHHRTPLIRYWQPFDNGDYGVSLYYYASVSSRDFMSAHRWGGWNRLTSTTGEEVCVPLSQAAGGAFWFQGGMSGPFDTDFTAHLVFDESGRLKTGESVMVPVCKYASSSEDKEYRALIRQEIKIFKDILLVQFNRIRDNVKYSRYEATPFSPSDTSNSQEYRTIGALLGDKLIGKTLDDGRNGILMQALISVGQLVYNTLSSKSAYSAGCLQYDWRSRTTTIKPEFEQPSFDAFIKAFERTVIKAVGGDRTSEPVLINGSGLFPMVDDVPRKYRFAPVAESSSNPDVHNVLRARFVDFQNRLSKV